MHTILVTTDTAANAKVIADFLSIVKTVKAVSIDPIMKKGDYNWTNPLHPATDEEFEQMIAECEKGEDLTLKDAERLSTKKINKWIKEQERK